MMSIQFTLTFFLGVIGLALANGECDPLTGTCPSIPGFIRSEYFIDFTQISHFPADWILADNEVVTFGPGGANFTFAKRLDAPYMWTNNYLWYGSVEISMQAAEGTGVISSATLISDDKDEIDWEISGNNFGLPAGRVQTNYFGKGITGNYDRGIQPAVDSPQTQFHTYTLNWTPASLTWLVDGVALRTLIAADTDDGSHQYPQTPMRVHLGLWDAGDVSNSPGTIEWAGGVTDLTQAPFTMLVRSVRITNLNPCTSYSYKDMSGSQDSVACFGGNETTASASGTSTPAYMNTTQASVTPPPTTSVSQENTTVTVPVSCSTVGPSSDSQSMTPAANLESTSASQTESPFPGFPTSTADSTTTTPTLLPQPSDSSTSNSASAAPTLILPPVSGSGGTRPTLASGFTLSLTLILLFFGVFGD